MFQLSWYAAATSPATTTSTWCQSPGLTTGGSAKLKLVRPGGNAGYAERRSRGPGRRYASAAQAGREEAQEGNRCQEISSYATWPRQGAGY